MAPTGVVFLCAGALVFCAVGLNLREKLPDLRWVTSSRTGGPRIEEMSCVQKMTHSTSQLERPMFEIARYGWTCAPSWRGSSVVRPADGRAWDRPHLSLMARPKQAMERIDEPAPPPTELATSFRFDVAARSLPTPVRQSSRNRVVRPNFASQDVWKRNAVGLSRGRGLRFLSMTYQINITSTQLRITLPKKNR